MMIIGLVMLLHNGHIFCGKATPWWWNGFQHWNITTLLRLMHMS